MSELASLIYGDTTYIQVCDSPKDTPEGAPIRPLAQYQIPIRAACSSRFHQDEVIRANPGLRHDSKTPRKKRAIASVDKFLAEAVAASTTPIES